jgi:3-phenylpropionate/cinnamic acid dioxygenase small subunit
VTAGSLAALLDRAEIADLVAGLAHAQDDRDWDTFRQLFADRILLNLTGHLADAPVDMTAEELASMARSTLDGFDATHHATSNVAITFDADEARCRVHVIAYHHVPAAPDVVDFCTMRGFWQLGMRKVDGRWRIHQWTIVRSGPYEGDPAVYQLAAARTRQTP